MLIEREMCKTYIPKSASGGVVIEGTVPRRIFPTFQDYQEVPSRQLHEARIVRGEEDKNIIVVQTDVVPFPPADKMKFQSGGFRKLEWVDKNQPNTPLHEHFLLFSRIDPGTKARLRKELRHTSEAEMVEIFRKMPSCLVSSDEGIIFMGGGRTLAHMKSGEGLSYEGDSVSVGSAYVKDEAKRFTPDMLRLVHNVSMDMEIWINTPEGRAVLSGKAGCYFASEDFDETIGLIDSLISKNALTPASLEKIIYPFFTLE